MVFLGNLLSRKFLAMVAGVIVSILVASGKIAPEGADAAIQTITGGIALVLSIVGYQVAEAKVDAADAMSSTIHAEVEAKSKAIGFVE